MIIIESKLDMELNMLKSCDVCFPFYKILSGDVSSQYSKIRMSKNRKKAVHDV